MSKSRIAKIEGSNQVFLGRDLDNVLKEGHVYRIKQVAHMIVLEDLGKHPTTPEHLGKSLSSLFLEGTHCMTQKEHETIPCEYGLDNEFSIVANGIFAQIKEVMKDGNHAEKLIKLKAIYAANYEHLTPSFNLEIESLIIECESKINQ